MTFLAGDELPSASLEKLANPPRCRVLGPVPPTTPQSLPNNTFTAIQFPIEDYKSNMTHDTVTNTTILTCTIAGKYQLEGGAYFAQNATGIRALKWQKNGVDVPASGVTNLPFTTGQPGIAARPVEVELAVGDFVALMAFQNSGGALDVYIAVDYARPSMSARLFRDNSL